MYRYLLVDTYFKPIWRRTRGTAHLDLLPELLSHLLPNLQAFASELCVSPAEIASKLQMAFLLRPTLRKQAALLGAQLQERVGAARGATPRLVVVDNDEVFAAAAVYSTYADQHGAGLATASPPAESANGSPRHVDATTTTGQRRVASYDQLASAGERRAPPRRNASFEGQGAQSAEISRRSFGHLTPSSAPSMANADELCSTAEVEILRATGARSISKLLDYDPPALVSALWRCVPPAPLPSTSPMTIMYTSGTSGIRPKGLVFDVGG